MSTSLTTNGAARTTWLSTDARAPMSTLQRLLLGAIVLEIPIQVDVNLFYQDYWADFGAIGGLNISTTTFCLGILYALWLFQIGMTSGFPGRRRLYVDFPLTAYVTIATLSVYVAQEKQLAINGLVLLIQAYLIYAYVANHVRTRSDVVFIVTLLLVSLAIQGAIMLSMSNVGHDIEIGPVLFVCSDDFRVGGTLGSPNPAAGYLELLIAPALAAVVAPFNRPTKLLACVALAVGSFSLLLTLSRGGWIAAGLSVALLCAVAWYRGWMSVWLPMVAAVIALSVGAIEYSNIASRIVADDQGSALSRVTLADLAGRIIADHPIVGVGVNNFAVAAVPYGASSGLRGEWFYTVHNKYLLDWAELGLPGLLLFVWFLLATVRAGWSAAKSHDRLMAIMALGLTVAVVGQMFHMSVDIFNGIPQVKSLWLSAGLIVAINRIQGAE